VLAAKEQPKSDKAPPTASLGYDMAELVLARSKRDLEQPPDTDAYAKLTPTFVAFTDAQRTQIRDTLSTLGLSASLPSS